MKQNETRNKNILRTGLTPRQLKTIPIIISCTTYTEGIKKAKVGRKTFYEWLKLPEFREEMARQRDEVTTEALENLVQSMNRAIEVLVSLLDNGDAKLKRLVCRDILDYVLKYQENKALEERLVVIEKALTNKLFKAK